MNKTVTINISGIIFHIEEDAYQKLSKYLSTIKGYFSAAEGRDEIVSDIESRVAELLREKTNEVKQVVVMVDVDYVISIMGQPEDFAEGSSENSTEENSSTRIANKTRRFFRDPDNKVLGGVCSGISAHFDMDPIYIRAAFAVLFFLSVGFVIPLYILLWIIIPEANTTAEKLEMRGETIDVNNISKAVKEEAENVRKRAEKFGNEFKDGSRPRNIVDSVLELLKTVLYAIGRVFVAILGFFLIVIGIALTFGTLGLTFGFATVDNAKVSDITNLIFDDGTYLPLAIFAALLTIGIPAIMMIYKGIKMLLRIKYSNRWINFSAGGLWLIGMILGILVISKVSSEFADDARIKQQLMVDQNVGDTLYLKINTKDMFNTSEANSNDYLTADFSNNKWYLKENNSIATIVGTPKVDIIASENDSIQILFIRTSRGRNKKEAYERAQKISYSWSQSDSIFYFNNYFNIDPKDKWRDQEVKMIIKVPKNKVVVLDKSLEDVLYDVENVSGTLDSDMLGRRWLMTANGLTCIDCNGLDLEDNNFVHPYPPAPNEPIQIDVNGVKINAEDAKVQMDKHGIKIDSKDAKVKIDKDGINIKTKNKDNSEEEK